MTPVIIWFYVLQKDIFFCKVGRIGGKEKEKGC
jgi:hypothetical protein